MKNNRRTVSPFDPFSYAVTLNTVKELFNPLFWSWIVNKDPNKTDTVWLSHSANYKAISNIETQFGVLTKMLSILDSEARSNFVRRDALYALFTNWIKHGHLPVIQDANKFSLRILGIINAAAQLAFYNGRRVNFFIFNSLATSTIVRPICVKSLYNPFVSAMKELNWRT